MSTLKVKLEGTNVTHEGADSGPETSPTLMDQARPANTAFVDGILDSPSRTRNERTKNFRENGLGRTIARSMERRDAASAPAPGPAPTPSPSPSPDYAAMQAEMASLKQQLASLQNPQPQYADGPIGDLQRRTDALPRYDYDSQQGDSPDYGGAPDPNNYDTYDDHGRAEYRKALDAHIQQASQRAVEADRAAQQQAWAMGEIERQCVDVRAKYGKDANYDEAAQAAKAIHLNARGELTIEQAYLQASDEIEARRGPRSRVSYMPKEIRGLGAMMEYRSKTGRARGR